jgi:putative lipoic acid-binding regulatory protein
MEKAIGEIVEGCACTVTPSNTSSTGRYHCLNVEMLVDDEGHRTGVYDRLQGHPAIKMVL